MKKSATAQTIASIAACMLAGTLSLQCGPNQPVTTGGGNAGGGVTSTGASTGGGGNSTGGSGGGGNGPVFTDLTLPLSSDAGSHDAEIVAATADANCGLQTQNPTPQPVDLLLVLDRSGSMAYDIASDNVTCGARGAPATCTARWSTITTSLTQVFAASPAGVQWGLKFFTSPKGQTCTVNPGADVAVGPNTAARIQTAIAGTSPANQTPTTAAINAAVAYFNTVNDGLPHYILLATDGEPNCDPGTSSAVTDASIQDTATVIATAAAAGIKTYVIGIGPSPGSLTQFAQNGGTTDYYPATSPDQLTTALSSIVVAVASCTFTMATVPPDPSNLGVYLDHATKVPLDPSDGYSLSPDNMTVTLNGSYCDGLKNGTYQVVEVYFGCGAPPPDQFW